MCGSAETNRRSANPNNCHRGRKKNNNWHGTNNKQSLSEE